MFTARPIRTVAASLCLFLTAGAALAASAKQYQFTGKITVLTKDIITVVKGDETSEFDRTPDLKVTGTLKVGEKVTVYYHMVADKAEVKDDKK